ncbi:MAG: VCBS repeat-containing protein [Planctomycetes bacterium]|nr:VCBS repeat-containing protein [Planctomycetota bacterium]
MHYSRTPLPLLLSLGFLAACGGGGGGGGNVVSPSATLSSLTADPLTAPADGATEILLTAVVRDTAGRSLGGQAVRFEATGAGAAGVTFDAAAVTAGADGIALSRMRSTTAGEVRVAAVIAPTGANLRLTQTVTVTFTAVTAPVVAGPARFEDLDANGAANAGDRVVVPFSVPVVVSGASAADFVLPVDGDTFGVGASVQAGPDADEVTIVLGTDPRLRTRGRFDAGRTESNEPSGVDVQNGAGIASQADGTPAAASAVADIAPAPVPNGAVALGGEHAAVGDVDGDGDLDLLLVGGGALRPLVNTGGSLSAAAGPSGSSARDVAMANLNRISADEAVTAEPTGAQVWNNTAAGGAAPAFTAAALIPAGDARSVAIADIDRDGFPDVLVGTATGVAFAQHQRNLGNSFAVAQTLPFGDATVALAIVDVDGDGDPDVLAAQGAGGVWLLRNDGGQLVADEAFALDGAVSVAGADLDGDGRVDVVAAGDATVRVFRRLAGGTVAADLDVVAQQVALLDLDGDAFADLQLRTVDGLSSFVNDRTGGFEALAAAALPGTQDLVATDLDDDGDDELLLPTATSTAAFSGSLAGTLGDSTLVPGQELGADAVGAQELADLDGDARIDRVVATAGGAQVWFGNGDGTFTVGTTFGGSQPSAIAIGDLDGDGAPDCVLGFDGNGVVFLNDGAGQFAADATFAAGSSVRSLALTDFEPDGDLDVFVGNDGQNQLFVNTPGAGTITLTENQDAFLGLLPQAQGNTTVAVIAWDFDRDGDEDLVLVNGNELVGPEDTYVLRRSGTGYTLNLTLPSQLLRTAATVGDADGDGRLDLAIAQLSPAGNASIVWFRGLATSLSTIGTNVATAGQFFSRSLVLADLDGDRRADFVIGDVSVANQPLTVLRQQADGSFVTAQAEPTTRCERFAAADLDRDGDLDVVTAESTGPSRVLANR